jgi:hypothetical protein
VMFNPIRTTSLTVILSPYRRLNRRPAVVIRRPCGRPTTAHERRDQILLDEILLDQIPWWS